jgi:hypothetical protein
MQIADCCSLPSQNKREDSMGDEKRGQACSEAANQTPCSR